MSTILNIIMLIFGWSVWTDLRPVLYMFIGVLVVIFIFVQVKRFFKDLIEINDHKEKEE